MSSQTDYACGTASESTPAEKADRDRSSSVKNEELLERIKKLEVELTGNDQAEAIEDRRPEWVFKQFESHWRADDKAESSLQPIRSAWDQFCDWMDQKGYQYLTDLTPRFPGRHDPWVVNHDEIDKMKLSRSMHLSRIRTVVHYANAQGWVYPSDVPDDDIWDEVKPELKDEDKVRRDPLPPERGERITTWLENDEYGSRAHVLWILLFRYGFRVSAIRALDREI